MPVLPARIVVSGPKGSGTRPRGPALIGTEIPRFRVVSVTLHRLVAAAALDG